MRHEGGCGGWGRASSLSQCARSLVAQSLSEEQQEKEQKERERLSRKAVKAALPSLSRFCDHRTAAAAAAVLLSGVISWWESEVMEREVSESALRA